MTGGRSACFDLPQLAKHLEVIGPDRRDKLITCPYFLDESIFQFIDS